MRFAIRADASVDIGHGHVTRCLTLAAALRDAGGDVLFVCRRLPGDLTDRIEREGFAVRTFVADEASAALDAERTLSALTTAGPVDWLIVDHYGLNAAWERSVRTHAHRVMVIDDLADRPHDCDLLLDQNIVAQAAARYVGLVPDECPLLLGPQYALLQPAYRQLREQTAVRHGPVARILIFWGGADRKGLTRRSLAAVVSTAMDVAVDVVVTRYSHELDDIRRLAKSHPKVRVHSDLPTLAPLLAGADLAVGAGGTTTWERLCLGVPALVVTVAENQRAIAQELSRRGLIEYLGHHDEVTDERLRQGVRAVLARDLREWSAACRSVVDGAGAERVARVLSLARPRFRVRPVEWADEALLLDWANDPITRANAFTTMRISAQEHHAWLSKRLVDPACRMFIVETDAGDAIGQVRFDRNDQGWMISYSVAPEWRGKRLGATMLSTAMRALQAHEPDAAFIGLVKEANQPSRRIFESLGFSARSTPGVVEYRSRPQT